MPYRATTSIRSLDRLAEVLDYMPNTYGYHVVGSMNRVGDGPAHGFLHPEAGKSFDEEGVIDAIGREPASRVNVTFSYGEQARAALTAFMGPLPIVTFKGILEGVESQDEFEDLLEESGEYWQ